MNLPVGFSLNMNLLISLLLSIRYVLIAVAVDFILGVFLSIINKTFDLRELPRVLYTSILKYVGGLIVLGVAIILVGDTETSNIPYKEIFDTLVASVCLKFAADIKDKLVKIYGEIVSFKVSSVRQR